MSKVKAPLLWLIASCFLPFTVAFAPVQHQCRSLSFRPVIDGAASQSTFSTQLNASLSPTVNIALISSSVAILSGYHLNLLQKELNSDTKTWRKYQADTREKWARHVRETEGWLYGIQSLRNAMTAQTFLASTVLSLLTLITGRVWDILRKASNIWERRLLTVQLASISLWMLLSAYQFLQGVRLMVRFHTLIFYWCIQNTIIITYLFMLCVLT